jgi:AmmeMemoRadiSam system protein A
MTDKGDKTDPDDQLTSQQRESLLKLAREAIATHLGDQGAPVAEIDEPAFEESRGAFVTLENQGRLRGCIGYSEPLYPLQEAVARCAVAAATQDHRFKSVTLEELPDVNISISALTPLRKLEDTDSLQPGRHGLMIAGQGRRGLLLPQVAEERGWNRETFLKETCRKAGLPADAWTEEDVEVFVFEAEVFGEE